MIPVTQETKTALHQAVKQIRAKITWATSATETQTITSEDQLISIKKEAEGYYCKSTLRKITIVLAGTSTNLLDQRITATVQVKTGANTWGDISWGSFNIAEAKIDEDKGTSTFTGYGGIAMLQAREYTAGELTFPTTVAGLAQQISEKFAIEIETDMTTLPNYDAPIAEDLWAKISGTTYRDILEEIAGATGTIAVIAGGNDQLDFALPPIAAASETLTEDNLITAKLGDSWGVVNAVVLSRQPQGDNIEAVDQQSVEETGQRTDLTITNNEILDKQRETTAQPILDAVKGWGYRNAEIKTEGHGYHEVGDRLDLTIAGTTYTTVVTKSTILVDGGISETLTGATPETVPIDYAKTGGITKTVFRTELAVDKQEQKIESIVSRQDATDAAVAEQFTQVEQNLTSIVATIQKTGGGNFIRNSVGYGKNSDGVLTIWEYGEGADANTVRSQSSPASLNAGAVSGYEIVVTGATISQPVNLTPGETYTLALRAQKGVTGSATITVGNSSESASITLNDQQAYAWQSQSVDFTPTMGANTVTITTDAGTTAEITDLILTTGGATVWRQASGEIYNTQVSLDQDGVRVSSSVYSGDYVEITPLEFAGYSNAGGTVQKVFSLNRDTTEVEKLEARSQIKMPPIKIVPINNSSYKGWAFVKEE